MMPLYVSVVLASTKMVPPPAPEVKVMPRLALSVKVAVDSNVPPPKTMLFAVTLPGAAP